MEFQTVFLTRPYGTFLAVDQFSWHASAGTSCVGLRIELPIDFTAESPTEERGNPRSHPGRILGTTLPAGGAVLHFALPVAEENADE